MGDAVNVLVIEDAEDDYLLLVRELKKSEYAIRSERVENAQELERSLARPWDVVISDNSLPQLNALRALQLVKRRTNAPFLIVSGTIREGEAVNAMKLGAKDYIAKSNMHRLVPAFTREMVELENRRKREEAEDALRQTEKQFKALTDSIGDVFFALDRDFRCIYWNNTATRTFGKTASQTIGVSYRQLFPVIPREAHLAIAETITMGIKTTATLELPDGTIYHMTCYPFNEGVSIILEDISEVKKLAFDLHKVNIELETFMYRLSHDLKGPLASMRGLVQLANRELKEAKAAQYCQMMEKSADRLKNVLESLLDITRVKAGEVNPEAMKLNAAMARVLDRFNRQLGRLPGEVSFPEDDLEIIADPVYINTILFNLIENGLRYGGGEGQQPMVHVTWSRQGHQVTLQVSDNGEGVPDQFKDRIFEMFYSAHETRSGSGLGLYIVKSAVQAMEGEITIDKREIRGTIVTITFNEPTGERVMYEDLAKI